MTTFLIICIVITILFLVPLKSILFIAAFSIAIYFWQITLSLATVILLFMFLKWLATELVDGINDFGNMRKDFGWDKKKKKYPDDDRIMHIGKEKMNDLNEWFNGKNKEPQNMPTPHLKFFM